MAPREKRSGQASGELRKALQMGEGEPQPWLVNMQLVNMQRYGPPPAKAQPQDPRAQRAHPRGLLLRLPPGWVGQAAGGRIGGAPFLAFGSS